LFDPAWRGKSIRLLGRFDVALAMPKKQANARAGTGERSMPSDLPRASVKKRESNPQPLG
jgi:hypothetical protein